MTSGERSARKVEGEVGGGKVEREKVEGGTMEARRGRRTKVKHGCLK